MAGIYVHIPFCRKACTYCNFHFSTNLKNTSAVVEAIIRELDLQKDYLPMSTLESIYFGGGTPGVLEAKQLEKIVEKIYANFDISINAEVTIELNPEDICNNYLYEINQLGVNRLSIGIQSFFDEDLIYMNRSHTAEKAKQALEMCASKGFNNFNIDLIYGYPLLSDPKWLSNLEQVLRYQVTHLSCYAMTVEQKTALWHSVKKGTAQNMNTDQQATQFEMLMQWASENNFEHYEISNLCKPQHRAVHNSNYWKGKPYLGIGPSAHSYNGHTRQWNISNNNTYIKSIENNILPFEIEILTPSEKINEYIMISLRTLEGINLNKLNSICTPNEFKKFMLQAYAVEKENNIYISDTHIILTKNGKLLADKISVDLFL